MHCVLTKRHLRQFSYDFSGVLLPLGLRLGLPGLNRLLSRLSAGDSRSFFSGFLSRRLGGERERETELELFRRRRLGGLRETDGESLRLRLRGGGERGRLSADEGDLRR